MTKKHYKPGLLGIKIGMTQIFDGEGSCRPVTVLQLGPCTVTQVKTQDKEGYDAVQVGYQPIEFRRLGKAMQGHFKKKDLKSFKHLRELRLHSTEGLAVGKIIDVSVFAEGERVDVAGVSKGKGFQGVIKRHHKGGGPASHGSHFHRSTGSIGQRTWPGRVFKLMKLPGHMGVDMVTVKNLKVIAVDAEKNRLILQGAVPGAIGSLLYVKSLDEKTFLERALKSSTKEAEESAA